MRNVWDTAQYERFGAERSRPFFDLLSLVSLEPDMRVIDLGCGTGELTRQLHRRLRARETIGIDSSAAMLVKSAGLVEDGLRFEEADIATFADEGRYDLVFSNAALQWVEDHEGLLSKLTAMLAEGGQLAVQLPANFDHPSHVVAAEVAGEEPYRTALKGYTRLAPVLPPEEYATMLERLGYEEQHVRLQVYGHHLESSGEVVEWVKGTLLTDYRKRMPENLYEAFLQRYRECLLSRLGNVRPYFYPFKRILFWAKL